MKRVPKACATPVTREVRPMSTQFTTLHRHARRSAVRAITGLVVLGALLIPAVPSVSAATSCEQIFTGDATGKRDVTASLTRFLDQHGGKRLCLKPYGKYRVDGTVTIVNEYGLRLDGRHAILRPASSAPSTAHRQQVQLESSRNVIIMNLNIRGTNPDHRRYSSAREHEHGIGIYGGDNMKLINIYVRDTYGDGIYLGYVSGQIAPPTRITLDRVNIARAGRNGIGIVGGSYLLVTSAVISGTGLHSIDLEPDTVDAQIHHVTIRRSSLRGYGHSNTYTSWAVAANGNAGSMRSLTVVGNYADRFMATIQNSSGSMHQDIVFQSNRSGSSGRAYFTNVDGLTFSGNSNIAARTSNVR